MTPSVLTMSSRAPNEPMSPTLMRQSKPSGRVTGSRPRPTAAATLCSMCSPALAPTAKRAPGCGTLSRHQSTTDATTMVRPTSCRKVRALRTTTRASVRGSGAR